MEQNTPAINEPWMYLPAQTSGTYTLFGPQLHFMKVTVPPGGSVEFQAYQNSNRQSGSSRIVISKIPYGQPMQWGRKDYVALRSSLLYFKLTDIVNQPVDIMTPMPMTWVVAPGDYYINTQNMENFHNSWTIIFTGNT